MPVFSKCESVHVLEINSGHSTKLPMLVTLINALLHYQTSSNLFQNMTFSGHLHAVVGHFAGLGTIARRYLLKTRTVGRLLRVLLSHSGSVNLPPIIA